MELILNRANPESLLPFPETIRNEFHPKERNLAPGILSLMLTPSKAMTTTINLKLT